LLQPGVGAESCLQLPVSGRKKPAQTAAEEVRVKNRGTRSIPGASGRGAGGAEAEWVRVELGAGAAAGAGVGGGKEAGAAVGSGAAATAPGRRESGSVSGSSPAILQRL
jgi:hypothetical protein